MKNYCGIGKDSPIGSSPIKNGVGTKDTMLSGGVKG